MGFHNLKEETNCTHTHTHTHGGMSWQALSMVSDSCCCDSASFECTIKFWRLMDVVAVCLTQQIPKKCVPAISLYEADVSNKRSNSTIEMTQWVVATPCDKPSQAIISFNACQVIHVPCLMSWFWFSIFEGSVTFLFEDEKSTNYLIVNNKKIHP